MLAAALPVSHRYGVARGYGHRRYGYSGYRRYDYERVQPLWPPRIRLPRV